MNSIEEVLSSDQIIKALYFYNDNKQYIEDMVETTIESIEPIELDDKNDPSIWIPEYWKWFINDLTNY